MAAILDTPPGVGGKIDTSSGKVISGPLAGTKAGTDSGAHGSYVAPTSSPPQITSSSGTARMDEANTGKAITTASDPTYASPSGNTAYIDSYIAQLHQRQAQEEANINASASAGKSALADTQARETGSTSAMLARAGGYLGVSGSGTGVLLNLAQTHRTEMMTLESKRLSALSDARNAYEDKNFQLASLKVADAKATEQEAYDRKQTYLKQVADQNALQGKQQSQVDIYNAIAGGTTDPMEIFQKLNGTVPINDINTFLTAVTPKDATGALAYTPAQTAHLIGSGLSAADIKAAQTYINANGYSEEFRAQLTPAQKVAFDAVYREKAVAAKVGGGLDVSFVPSKIQGVVAQYGVSRVFEDLLSPSVPAWFMPVLHELATNHYQDIGLGAPSSLDPSSAKAQEIWKQFKGTTDITMFLSQVTKKITGSSTGGTGTGSGGGNAAASYGALGGSLPPPVTG